MIKKIIVGLLGLLTLYVLVVWFGVFPRSTETQIQALNLLEQPYQHAKGKNDAFPQLWLMEYDIPGDKIPEAYAEYMLKYQNAMQGKRDQAFDAKFEKKYPKQTLDTKDFCPAAPKSCLSYVRENPDRAREQVALYAKYLERAERLRHSDHVRIADNLGYFDSMLPLGNLGQLQTLASAVDFIDGKQDQALDLTCLNLASWRRLRSHTDMLMIDLSGIRWAKIDMVLLADMLAEMPADMELPLSCGIALAPLAAEELDQCDVARGEMKFLADFFNVARRQDRKFVVMGMSDTADLLRARFINVRASSARVAPIIASLCPGQPVTSGDLPVTTTDRFFDPGGVYFSELIFSNDYQEYKKRAQDFAGLLQTMRTLVWLRSQPDIEQASSQQPEHLKMPNHKLVWDKSGKTLSIDMLNIRPNDPKTWVFPMAASRIASEPVAQ